MLKSGQKNNYREFLKKKRQFAEKVKPGRKFKDTDHDGLSDYEEKNIYRTDPKNPDTDGDGMPDGAEVKRGRNPLGPGKLKNLFIPHAGNNYSPHVLKPKRLLFHAISVVAMKAIVVVFILFYPLSAWLSPDLALVGAKKIIELTNNLRQAISLPALLENRQLTQAAWQKVEDMALNQYFAHVSPTGFGLRNWLEKIGYKYAVAGENLAVGFSDAKDVVEAWKNSPTHYANITDGDFKEIGVALANGKLNQIDTVFVAQYFAAPAPHFAGPSGRGTPVQTERPVKETVKNQKIAAVPSSVKPAKPVISRPAPETEVKGAGIAKETTEPALGPEKLSKNKITIDQAATILSIKSDLLNQIKILQIETILPADAVSAEVIINSHKIILEAASGGINRWRGAALISQGEEKNIFNPLIPATVAVNNSAGVTKYGEIDWDKVEMIKATPLEHYQFFKTNPAAAMAPIMNLSNAYFKLILLIAIISLLLNIFIEIRKQHPHVIFYSFAFIGLLLAMIIF